MLPRNPVYLGAPEAVRRQICRNANSHRALPAPHKNSICRIGTFSRRRRDFHFGATVLGLASPSKATAIATSVAPIVVTITATLTVNRLVPLVSDVLLSPLSYVI